MRPPTMRLLICTSVLFVAACSKLPLALPSGAPVGISVQQSPEETRKFELPRSSAKHHQLELWLSSNQYGWSQYLATTPGKGIYVSLVGGYLQFVGSLALACPNKGACLQKTVERSEYSFLETP
jgi:hypothetical protein